MSWTPIESLLKRESAVVAGALIILILLAWLATIAGAGTGMRPAAMSGWWLPMRLPAGESWDWTPYYWLIAFFMWAAMMVAMMLPSAAPVVLLYAAVMRRNERQSTGGAGPAAVTAFGAGYLSVILFSGLAVALQFALERSGLITVMMASGSAALSGGLLIGAGIYQLSPLKAACLRHCRGPARFLADHWRPGVAGAWHMGLIHGSYCVGCCAALMLLLFVGGVMNLVWIAGLTLFAALEKLAPFGSVTTKVAAIVLIAAGAGLIVMN